MRLIRNETEDGTCKYALIRLDRIHKDKMTSILTNALNWINDYVEFGLLNSKDEFFVIKLQDKNAAAALRAYADSANLCDPELAADVLELAIRSESMNTKPPD